MPEYSSSDSTSVSSGSARVRLVRLVRPAAACVGPLPGLTVGRFGPGFGFSVRGGREHGTGFFVSHIESGSEAQTQGLREGDQIVRVNGYQVEDAIHKELLQFISHQTRLKLKVRGVGMLPVRERCSDPLTWQIVPEQPPTLPCALEEHSKTVKITMSVAPRAKLGCGIWKGPEWKPGIFVQFTKENGIAREAGLRPGDQILRCNGQDFDNITFAEAVSILKQPRELELVILPRAGLDLFPGESSGYNSSASSVTGDQSPSCPPKRLSIVKEELDMDDRFGHFRPKSWDRIDLDWAHDNQIPENFSKQFCKNTASFPSTHHSDQNNCTIIKLSENGTTINNNPCPEQNGGNINTTVNKCTGQKLADICLVSTRDNETKTVLVEVHRSEQDNTMSHVPPPTSLEHTRNNSICSVASGASSGSSLSSAISEELKRRAERTKEISHSAKSINPLREEDNKKKLLSSIQAGSGTELVQRHDALMDEFRRAHRKMFKNGNATGADGPTTAEEIILEQDREQRVPESGLLFATRETSAGNYNGVSRRDSDRHGPPPPPPMPCKEPNIATTDNSTTSKHTKSKPALTSTIKIPPPTKPKAPAPPIPHQDRPPLCPSPDYDTISIVSDRNGDFNGASEYKHESRNRVSSVSKGRSGASKASSEAVEMESLESFKINNPPANPRPKPPQTYFHAQLSGTATMRKTQKPVSVTIGEYPSGTSRKEPSRLDFLGTAPPPEDVVDAPISKCLQSELVQTLSRSNLKKKTEPVDMALNGNGATSNASNGIIKISLNNDISKPVLSRYAKNLQCNTDTLSKPTRETNTTNVDKIANMISSKIMINIPTNKMETNGKMELRKSESSPPSGILKNGTNNVNQFNYHRPVTHQKSITFGKITTVIGDIK